MVYQYKNQHHTTITVLYNYHYALQNDSWSKFISISHLIAGCFLLVTLLGAPCLPLLLGTFNFTNKKSNQISSEKELLPLVPLGSPGRCLWLVPRCPWFLPSMDPLRIPGSFTTLRCCRAFGRWESAAPKLCRGMQPLRQAVAQLTETSPSWEPQHRKISHGSHK